METTLKLRTKFGARLLTLPTERELLQQVLEDTDDIDQTGDYPDIRRDWHRYLLDSLQQQGFICAAGSGKYYCLTDSGWGYLGQKYINAWQHAR